MTWLRLQGRAIAGAFRRLLASALGSLLSILAIGIALSLPLGLYLVLENLNGMAGHLNAEPQLSLYLSADAGNAEVQQIESHLKGHPAVARYRFIPRDEALEEMKASTGFADLLEGLERNPLPHAFIVRTKDNRPEALERLKAEILNWHKVEHVLLDSAWARKLAAFNAVGQKLVLLLAAILGVALVAVTGNTIRLQILTQRDEIEVGRLIGATDGHIRRPYLYFGALQGLLGGLCGVAIAAAAGTWLETSLLELLRLYAADFRLRPLSVQDGAAVMGASTLIGWLGAYASVGLYLRQIRPR